MIRTLLAVLVFVVMAPVAAQADEMVHDQIWIQIVDGGLLNFNVEIAETPRHQEVGLMYRTYLAEDSGMLFTFGDDEKMRSFWMKDTLIPLDILFLAGDGTIHHIHHMARPQDEAMISSKRPSAAALEINGGYTEGLGIKVGDKVLHPMFRNMLAQ